MIINRPPPHSTTGGHEIGSNPGKKKLITVTRDRPARMLARTPGSDNSNGPAKKMPVYTRSKPSFADPSLNPPPTARDRRNPPRLIYCIYTR